ncbi:MAG: glycosyltransferase family 4 protein [Bacilli bacterium]|nr:glycosyltransferase family 4 protein [Bacilli bacterium]
MKILIVSQKFHPEPFRIFDIAKKFVSFGHEVTVLCGIPNYPEGEWYKGYSRKENRVEEIEGIHIVRAYESPRKAGIMHRLLNYYSFSFFGKRKARKLEGDFDVIFLYALSPLMMADPAIGYKRKYGAKILMYGMDPWPESLLIGGIKKDSLIYNHYKRVSRRIYGAMDYILVSTKDHIPYIENLVGKPLRIDYLPQYSNDVVSTRIKRKEGEPFHILFAGNLGIAQGLETVIEGAALLKEEDNVIFDIIGDGSEFESLRRLGERLNANNVLFHSRVPIGELGDFYAKADMALVTLNASSYCNMTIPGKIQGYLKNGIPILSMAGSATDNLVDENLCGVVVPSHDKRIFAAKVKECAKLKESVLEGYGKNGKALYEKEMAEERYFAKVMPILESLAKEKGK